MSTVTHISLARFVVNSLKKEDIDAAESLNSCESFDIQIVFSVDFC